MDNKTFFFCQQNRKPIQIKDGSKELFYYLFPYFRGCPEYFYYMTNALCEPGQDSWGCAMTVFTGAPNFLDPQLITTKYPKTQLLNLLKFLNLPDILFESAEKDILLYYDKAAEPLEQIADKWRSTIPIPQH